MDKKEELIALLQPYRNENVITEIPDERKKMVDLLIIQAEDFDIYDEMINIIKENQGKDFDAILNMIVELFPPLEIVDDDEINEEDRLIVV